jgi:hypothetical protein
MGCESSLQEVIISVGTSGRNYPLWQGAFYPPNWPIFFKNGITNKNRKASPGQRNFFLFALFYMVKAKLTLCKSQLKHKKELT